MAYRVDIARSAEGELEALYLWVIERAPQQGASWFNGLERAVLSLDQHPERCPVASESIDPEHPVRVLRYGRGPQSARTVFGARRSCGAQADDRHADARRGHADIRRNEGRRTEGSRGFRRDAPEGVSEPLNRRTGERLSDSPSYSGLVTRSPHAGPSSSSCRPGLPQSAWRGARGPMRRARSSSTITGSRPVRGSSCSTASPRTRNDKAQTHPAVAGASCSVNCPHTVGYRLA